MPIFSLLKPSQGANHPNAVVASPANAKSVSPQIAVPQKSVVAEPANRPPASRRMAGRGHSTPSILDALREESKSEDPGIVSEVIADQYIKSDKAHPFTQEELLGVWRIFVSTIDAAQLKSALGTREPNITGDAQIEYELDTELQFNRLALDLKPKLQSYLRHYFQNDAIEILFRISATSSQTSNIPYTDAERWALLVEKYPALATLKSKFGLDFEHF